MTFTVSFDPLHLLGLLVCGYFASLVGNILGTLVVNVRTPSLDWEQRFFMAGILLRAAAVFTPVKLFVAFSAAAVSMYLCSTDGAALAWTISVTGAIGLVFSLLLAGSIARDERRYDA